MYDNTVLHTTCRRGPETHLLEVRRCKQNVIDDSLRPQAVTRTAHKSMPHISPTEQLHTSIQPNSKRCVAHAHASQALWKPVSARNMAQNGTEWHRTAQNGTECHRMSQSVTEAAHRDAVVVKNALASGHVVKVDRVRDWPQAPICQHRVRQLRLQTPKLAIVKQQQQKRGQTCLIVVVCDVACVHQLASVVCDSLAIECSSRGCSLSCNAAMLAEGNLLLASVATCMTVTAHATYAACTSMLATRLQLLVQTLEQSTSHLCD